MITVERVSKFLTANGFYTTESSINGKLLRNELQKRAMSDLERKTSCTKYNFLIDESSFMQYALQLGIEHIAIKMVFTMAYSVKE